MIRRLRERLLAPRAPSGYRAGATLACLARNLGQQGVAAAGVVQDPAQGWQARVYERVEAHLLMHVVTCEFQLQLPALQGGEVTLELRHTGALRRTGLACVYRKGDRARFAQVRDRLLQQAALLAALMPLDFKRLILVCRDGQWQLALEHMGGSEVVNRMPAFRRYISISPQQRAHLMASLAHFNSLLPTL
ncbi:hypothetical protein PPUJ20028_21140 [Pseudomonas putida]|uniref:DUF3156 family protein n=1 Tax=Pseudomonas putida TaxID=303 RepID=A0AA37RCL7_PSEPU|nr:DUF3156 family protein [Pseudomonas putida]GLO13533.1 hypothetical protein PPUJ20028_21140 [Pseudomonas putida]GLO36445.1 hypothetical protein PPUN14671_32800 [Pseudomonas putida]HDS0963323.1 DUF3156 family protein [Pseudomonas putida]HDS0991784.1 DUF3156 family protein [Pseudomonas putida]